MVDIFGARDKRDAEEIAREKRDAEERAREKRDEEERARERRDAEKRDVEESVDPTREEIKQMMAMVEADGANQEVMSISMLHNFS